MAERATLTTTKPLPPAIVLRLKEQAERQERKVTVDDIYGDNEANDVLRAAIGQMEKHLDGMAAKLGMKPSDNHETQYGFSFDDCWYQRSYRRG